MDGAYGFVLWRARSLPPSLCVSVALLVLWLVQLL